LTDNKFDWVCDVQTAGQVMNLNVARIRDVELLTGLEFFRSRQRRLPTA